MSFFRRQSKKAVLALVGLFVVVNTLGSFFLLQPARAISPVQQVTDLPLLSYFKIQDTQKKVNLELEDALWAAALGGLIEAGSFFFRKLAYDTATYIATGGKGQGALIFKDPGAYFSDVAGDAVASGIGELGAPFGIDLCKVPDPRFNLWLKIGLRSIYGHGPPRPNCTWQQLTKGGIFDPDAWNERYGSQDKLLDTFSTSLRVENTDFGVALGGMGAMDRLVAQKIAAAETAIKTNDGFKPVTSLISGDVLTPGQFIKKETEKLSSTEDSKIKSQQISGIYGTAAWQIIPSAASVFLNTLTSKLLERALTEGLFPDSGGRGGDEIGNLYASELVNRRLVAQNAFNELLVGLPVKQLTDYNIVSQFAACPQNPGLNNCVIDSGLQRAISQAATGDALTVREALDAGHLQGSWPLISPRRTSEHTDTKGCQVGKYCYSNLQKLRKVRILPLGFEVAALLSDPDNPWTLGQVVDNFENCRRDEQGNVVPDVRYPFCHLINPNWVIRAPATRCETSVIGPELVSPRGNERREECVDVTTCIDEGPNGECIGSQYAYCTKESNVWRIGADSCPAHFNTCDGYLNTQTQQVVSYLSRTVDFGQCSADSVGCLAYSTERQGESWVNSYASAVNADQLGLKEVGRNQTIYFNRDINTASNGCPVGSDGCHAFKTAEFDANGEYVVENGTYVQSGEIMHMKKAPDYLGCYDTEPDVAGQPETFGISWPTTRQEVLNLVNQDASCDAYASVCLEEEVGCEGFQLVRDQGAPVIPGIIGEQHVCPAVCEGYETFKQVGYQEAGKGFEPEVFPTYFIADAAVQCDASVVGCDEFTNIDVEDRGGEAREYYTSMKHCEEPKRDETGTITNQAVYYSWEGSVDDGFVLRTYRVLPVQDAAAEYLRLLNLQEDGINVQEVFPEGSPAYNDDVRPSLVEQVEACNAENYQIRIEDPLSPEAADPDCRALFDDDGNTFYRLRSNLVTVSDACHPLRKTEANLVRDDALSVQGGAGVCGDKGGLWVGEDVECLRCTNGGTYRGGSCVYQTISTPGESESCLGPAEQPDLYAGCRAYVGNAGRNVKDIFNGDEDFEVSGDDPDALRQARRFWSAPNNNEGIEVVADAIDLGAHSLQVRAERTWRNIATGTLKTNVAYELTFWARGDGAQMRVRFADANGEGDYGTFTFDPVTAQETALSPGILWQEYRLGPVSFTGPTNQPVSLVFLKAGGDRFFLDHVRITQLPDTNYLIKDSWQTAEGYDVPLACDQNPDDGLPGAMLGCAAYEVVNTGQVRYATGFEELCRPKAVGCQPLWDTQNTVSINQAEKAHAYQVWCEGAALQTCQVQVDGDVLGECEVPRNSAGCYVDHIVLNDLADLPEEHIQDGTIMIPADTPSTTPFFLARRPEFDCNGTAQGCMQVGAEMQVLPEADNPASYEFNQRLIKNNPDEYESLLCRDDLVGCGEYRSGDETFYFKDPQVNGNALCSYRAQANPGQDEVYGWFREGVGKCEGGDAPGALCRTNADCAGGGTCADIGNIECYDGDFRRAGGYSDIYSAGNVGYQNGGFVGMCPDQFNGCTELVDTADEDSSGKNKNGKPYYVIFNEQLEGRIGACNGQVSLSEGCVLFDQTDRPNKTYDTAATYARSEAANPKYSPVDPVQNPATNDANIILKVDRDRACSEWLSCRSSVPQVMEDGTTIDLCYEYAACDALDSNGRCISWVENQDLVPGVAEGAARLTYDTFVRRPTSWYDHEFVGYSLFDKYQVNQLQYFFFESDQYDALKEGEVEDGKIKDAFVDVQSFVGFVQEPYELEGGVSCNEKEDWQPCGAVVDGVNKGRCFNGYCVYPHAGEFSDEIVNSSTVAKALEELEINSCKGFPEPDSPFPLRVGEENPEDHAAGRQPFDSPNPTFREANFCQDGNCSCNYKEVEFDNGESDYVSVRRRSVGEIQGVCTAGNDLTIGKYCDGPDACGEGGECSMQKRVSTHIGLEGYCLEYDLSRPINGSANEFACLTWLPIEISASGADLYNSAPEAGYVPEIDAVNFIGEEGEEQPVVLGGKVYCAAATEVRNGFHALPDELEVWDWMDQGQNQNNNPDPNNPFNNNVPQVPRRDRLATLYTIDTASINHISDLLEPDPDLDEEDHWGVSFYSQFFKTDLDRRDIEIRVNDRQCGATVDEDGNPVWVLGNDTTPFEYATCISDPSRLYQALQVWSWNKLGPNAVVLRVEMSPNDPDRNYEGGISGLYPFNPTDPVPDWFRVDKHRGDTNECGVGESPLCTPYHFAAMPPNQPDGWNYRPQGVYELGVMMHPPRTWGEPINIELNNGEWFFGYRSTADNNMWVDSHAMSPEVRIRDRVNEVHKMANRYFEGSVHEGNLDSVYFVPTMYPYEADEYMPAIMKDSFNLPLLDLRGSEERAKMDKTWVTGRGRDLGPATVGPPEHNLDRAKHGWRWAYMQERGKGDEGYGLTSFQDYPAASENSVLGQQRWFEGELGVRNRIHRRYVSVWFIELDNGHNPFGFNLASNQGIDAALRPAQEDTDPFTIPCTAGDDDRQWVAIGMDFNQQGEFLGYITRYCYGDDAMHLTTVATLVDQCLDFRAVYDDDNTDPQGTSNKAWTNRVWAGALSERGQAFVPFGRYANALGRDQLAAPYGTIPGLSIADVTEEGHADLRRHSFSRESLDGIPYACSNAAGADTLFELFDEQYNRCPLKYEANAALFRDTLPLMGRGQAQIALDRLFAKYYARATMEEPLAPGEVVNFDFEDQRQRDVSATIGDDTMLPPQIYSLNPVTCNSAESDGTCTAGERYNFSINGRNGTDVDYDDDGFDDEDGDLGEPKAIVAFGSYRAVAKFFAFANDNRMPIRRVTMKWGDRSIPRMTKGLYKNRKPYCGSTNSGGVAQMDLCVEADTEFTGLTCQVADGDFACGRSGVCTPAETQNGRGAGNLPNDIADHIADGNVDESYAFERFGNAPRACMPRPFEFRHTYTCGPSDLAASGRTVGSLRAQTQARLLAQGIGPEVEVCYYKPAVQVLDNWGWCNGSIFTDQGEFFGNNPEGIHQGITKKCDQAESNEPWTYYQGEIIVVPPQEEE